MKILDLVQGTPEWLSARLAHFCASDAPSMLGLSKHKSRTALLREKKTGESQPIDDRTQALFDRGHEAESSAKPFAEDCIGETLSALVGVRDVDGLPLLASFDGITKSHMKSWEHKLYAEWLAEYIENNLDLPDSHWPQVEHQMLVSGSNETLFMVSNGAHGDDPVAILWYESQPERRARVIAGWKQFAKDLETFVVKEEEPEIVAAEAESLPVPFGKVNGVVALTHNLNTVREALDIYIKRYEVKPTTEQGFADLNTAAKELRKAEEGFRSAKEQGLAQVSDVQKFADLCDKSAEIARQAAIKYEKWVSDNKTERKNRITDSAKADFLAHIRDLNAALGMTLLVAEDPDFAQAAIRGLKSIESMENAVSTALAQKKIDANEAATKIGDNLALYRENSDHAFLFNDISTIALRPCNEFAEIVQNRIATHRQKEEERLNAERERIRREEQARADREARERAKAEALAQEQDKAEEAKQQPEIMVDPDPEPSPEPAKVETVAPANATASNDAEQTITLGEIGKRLGFSLPASVIEEFGIHSVGRARAAILYCESDFSVLCLALIERIRSASAQSTKKAA